MLDQDSTILPDVTTKPPSHVEVAIERGLYRSRWMLTPMYIGLCVALILPVWMFLHELVELLLKLPQLHSDDVILGVLELIDLTMVANLVLIVVYSGYENFISKLNLEETNAKGDWKTKVDFSSLKMKLIASMVAISGIQLLKAFMQVDEMATRNLIALVCLHLVFVVSGVLLALMDLLSAKANRLKDH